MRWTPYIEFRCNMTETQWNQLSKEEQQELYRSSSSGQSKPSTKRTAAPRKLQEPRNSEDVDAEEIHSSYTKLAVRIVTPEQLAGMPVFRR